MTHPQQVEFEKDMIKPLSREEAISYTQAYTDIIWTYSFATIRIFSEFTGLKLSKVILNYLISLNPRQIRIYGMKEGVKMDSDTDRITIFLDVNGRIEYIEYGIRLSLPNINHDLILCDGHIMGCLLEDQKREELRNA